MTISRVKFPWPPFFRIFIFFDEVFNSVRGTTYLMRDDGATVVNVRSSRVIWSFPNPTDLSVQPCIIVYCMFYAVRCLTELPDVPTWHIPALACWRRMRAEKACATPLEKEFAARVQTFSMISHHTG